MHQRERRLSIVNHVINKKSYNQKRVLRRSQSDVGAPTEASELRRMLSEGSGVIMNPFKSPLGLFVFGVKIG